MVRNEGINERGMHMNKIQVRLRGLASINREDGNDTVLRYAVVYA